MVAAADIPLSRLHINNSNTAASSYRGQTTTPTRRFNMASSAGPSSKRSGKRTATRYSDNDEDAVTLLESVDGEGARYTENEGDDEEHDANEETSLYAHEPSAPPGKKVRVKANGSLRWSTYDTCSRQSKLSRRTTGFSSSNKDRSRTISFRPGGRSVRNSDPSPFTNRVMSDKTSSKYPANVVRNQKYNFATFLPLVFYEQFKFFFNLYFLLVALSQFIPALKIGTSFCGTATARHSLIYSQQDSSPRTSHPSHWFSPSQWARKHTTTTSAIYETVKQTRRDTSFSRHLQPQTLLEHLLVPFPVPSFGSETLSC